MLISRVADPRNFLLVGLPPKDMLEDVAAAWIANGLNVDDCFKRALSVTGEWVYDPSQGPLKTRIRQRRMSEFTIPLKNRTLAEVLEPQPAASVVIKKLLAWMDRVDTASQHPGMAKPEFKTADGEPIFPENDDPWCWEIQNSFA